MTTVTFREHKFVGRATYKCLCGHRFARSCSSYWTENPFSKLWMEGKVDELNKKTYDEVVDMLKDRSCPKCDLTCLPIKEPHVSQRM